MVKHYQKIFLIVILIKLLYAWVFPVTTDEAYWLILGNHLDVNYYDHPPMSGWFIYLSSLLGHHVFFARLHTILYGILVALGIHFVGKQMGYDAEKTKLASLAFLVSPLHVLFVLIATDTPLCVFAFLSGVVFYLGNVRDRRGLVLLSGILLGLAVLSKYFSGLLLIGMVASLFICFDWKKALTNSIILVAGAMPFVLLHLYWNSMNCWTNIMFNVINRNQNIEKNYTGILVFIAFQIYLCTPWLLYHVYRDFDRIKQGIRKDRNLFFTLFCLPNLLLGVVSLHHTGLHWYFSFYPFLFLFLFYLRADRLRRIVKYSAVFTLAHLLFVAAVLMLPVETFKNTEFYDDLLTFTHGDEIYQAIQKKYGDNNYILAANGYSPASVLTYYSGHEFIVFAGGSKYGRHFDKLNDFRAYDGRDILIVADAEDIDDYFDQVEHDTITVRGQVFPITIGKGFRYRNYRDRFLAWIQEKFYNIPDFLPIGRCFFYDMYFSADGSAE